MHRRWGSTYRAPNQIPITSDGPALTFFKPLKPDDPSAADRVLKLLTLIAPSDQVIVGISSGNMNGPNLRLLAVNDPRLTVIFCASDTGKNPKVAKLVEMENHARNRFWVLTDSEVEPAQEWIAETRFRLSSNPATLLTAVYRFCGMQTCAEQVDAAAPGLFLWPGVAMRLAMGPPDFAFGALIAFDGTRFATAGGFSAIGDQLADDHAIATIWRRQGGSIQLISTIVTLQCDRLTWTSAWQHQQRVARTYRELAPWGFAGAILLNPVIVAVLGSLPFTGMRRLSVGAALLGARWLLRKSTARSMREERCTHHPHVFIVGAIMEACAWLTSWLPLRIRWGEDRLQVRSGKIQ